MKPARLAIIAAIITSLAVATVSIARGGDGQGSSKSQATASVKAKAAAGKRGKRGKRGPAGPAGARGPQGPEGPRGNDGVSNAYYMQKNAGGVSLLDVAEFVYKDIIKLEALPAGSYLVTGEVVAAKRGGGAIIRCRINTAAGAGIAASTSVSEAAGHFLANVVVTSPIISNAPFDAVLQCSREYVADAQETFVESIRLHAIRVGNLDVRSIP